MWKRRLLKGKTETVGNADTIRIRKRIMSYTGTYTHIFENFLLKDDRRTVATPVLFAFRPL